MMQRLQGIAPMLVGVLLISMIAVFATQWLGVANGAVFVIGLVTVVLYVLWVLAEGRLVATKEVNKQSTRIDRGTMELYAASRGVVVLLSLGLSPSMVPRPSFMAGGLVLMTAAITWRMVAIATLGRYYSHRVRLSSDHTVVSNGPYRYVRHPAYTGMLLAHIGFSIVFFNFWALAAVLCLLLPAIVVRIWVEERELMTVPGYADYARGRKRLCPLLW